MNFFGIVHQPIEGVGINGIVLFLNRETKGPSEIKRDHGIHRGCRRETSFVHVTDDYSLKIQVSGFQNPHNLEPLQWLSLKWQLHLSEHLLKKAHIKFQSDCHALLLLE